ncbi:SKA complex subunit 1 isoform X2 [Myripristis murdjan]|uniref:SKA complex subunit 1 isoform X2 n=1 Tax=Myripristis murdjan TaxID=586833 RepID=UPI0011762D2A|nr:spindle and kinetochore-associated protein 1 isoform X2 [Myripristis murdjan]
MSELEEITMHITDRISSLQRMLELSTDVIPQNRLKKFGQEVFVLEGLLYEFEKCVGRQHDHLKHLQELEGTFQKDLEDMQHLKEKMPAHMPRRKLPAVEPAPSQNGAAMELQPRQQENVRKTNKSQIKEMEFISMPEFESIPQYMKGRLTYSQLNAAVESINRALAGKYKILHQSVKTLNNHSRRLYQRFKEEETKNTKGQYFVVEADIREFAEIKVDKRFQGILNMLRHCQRIREQRGGGLTRYVLL